MSRIDPKSNDWVPVPLSELTDPHKPGPLMVYHGCWWAVDDNDNAYFYKGRSPQCNRSPSVVMRLMINERQTRSVYVEWAWVKFNISDYV